MLTMSLLLTVEIMSERVRELDQFNCSQQEVLLSRPPWSAGFLTDHTCGIVNLYHGDISNDHGDQGYDLYA